MNKNIDYGNIFRWCSRGSLGWIIRKLLSWYGFHDKLFKRFSTFQDGYKGITVHSVLKMKL